MNTETTEPTTETNKYEVSLQSALVSLGYESETHLTGYKIAKLVTEATGHFVRPQMCYNYLKKGFIKSTSATDVTTWILKFAAKNSTF
jgi:hypothetical protein